MDVLPDWGPPVTVTQRKDPAATTPVKTEHRAADDLAVLGRHMTDTHVTHQPIGMLAEGSRSDAADRPFVAFVDANPALGRVFAQQLAISGEVQCKGFTTSEIDLCRMIADLSPDVLIIDPMEIGLSADHDLSDFVRGVLTAGPNLKMLCYSFGSGEDLLRAVMNAHLHGCVSKESDFDQLQIAVSALLAGGIYFDPHYAGELWAISNRNGFGDHGLSKRELAVAMGTARGQSSKQIAQALGISSKTVDTYRSRALRKLGLRDRPDLVAYAVSHNWLS